MSALTGKKVMVIGVGNMGGALISGMVEAGVVDPASLTAVDVVDESLKRAAALGTATCRDAAEVIEEQEVVVLALKPQIWEKVVNPYRDRVSSRQVLISIMGGVRTESVERVFGEVPVVRSMPNILAQLRCAVSAVCAGAHAEESHLATAEFVLGSVGETVRLSESQLDAVTGLSGSGPAYVYAMIDALADGGVRVGLPKDVSLNLAARTVLGAARVVLETGKHPAVLKDEVTSPGGTTIAGLKVLEEAGFRAALMAAVEAATERSKELGQ